ncbi:MAG: hypothetical protein HYZ34_01910 [Ignavibacteriae bacterium]|nr:hypothetical protein [Ignavibacteriota bacterium]
MRRILTTLFLLFLGVALAMSQEQSNNMQHMSYKLDDGIISLSNDEGKTWQSISSSEPVQLLAWHPERADMFLAVAKNVLYRVYEQSNTWYPVLSRGENFTPVQVKHSKLKWWEVWLVGTTEEERGGTHTEILYSGNGGASWSIVQYTNEHAEDIQLNPDNSRKFWVGQPEINNKEGQKP